jgi:phosphohistidine swiveling domain-containing protein
LLQRITQQFSPVAVIVRSSALREDGDSWSMAGAYNSVKDVNSTSAEQITTAVQQVIGSYGPEDVDANEVLVQPMIDNVSMSGVVFSHDLSTGAPYYVVNYDDETGLTDTVTSGTTDTSRTLLIHREHVDQLQSPRFRALLRSVQEIEALAAVPGVDLEFAVTGDEKIHIFQARRLAVSQNWNRDTAQHIGDSLKQIQTFLEGRMRPMRGVLGNTSLFGEMPDWNPAEMIGAVPRPLAKSLYERLITDSVWAEARAEMGYRDLSGRPLMSTLGGRVYVDIRESLNSFLPADLPDEIGEKLVSAWLARLKERPDLHDKIEFEVAITACTLDFDDRVQALRSVLNVTQLDHYKQLLSELTTNILTGRTGSPGDQQERIASLDAGRLQLLENVDDNNKLQVTSDLLRECSLNGTRPFAIMARRGFVAEDLLRSMQARGILTADRVTSFRASVSTVLTEFLGAMQQCQRGESDWSGFMQTYGHLRPGTYDILASRYDQHEDMRGLVGAGKPAQVKAAVEDFSLTSREAAALDRALAEAGLDCDSTVVLDFMRGAIAGREHAKLVFTRSVSDALELIAAWGIENGLNREELSFLTISQITASLNHSWHLPLETHFRQLAKEAREAYEISQALRLPYLISALSDIYVVPLLKSRANFVTRKRVQAPLHHLSDHVILSPRCAGKVVLIERADPGYDWIFLSPIAGLVTKYGGSNSHMAIRCAELGVPAAIGCGEQVFDQLEKAHAVLLDCAAGVLTPVG